MPQNSNVTNTYNQKSIKNCSPSREEFNSTLWIKTIDGKNFLDASQFLEDVSTHLANLKKKYGAKVARRHPLRRLENSISGNYFTPSNMSGFMDSPAGLIWSAILPKRAVLETGSIYHRVMERVMQEIPRPLTNDSALEAAKTIAREEFQIVRDKGSSFNAQEVKLYVENTFTNGLGYYRDIDWLNQESSHELFMKVDGTSLLESIPFLDAKDGPPPFETFIGVIDRVDFAVNPAATTIGNVIIDYKTGKYFKSETFGLQGYLPQMITYKWLVENQFNSPVLDVFLFTPGWKDKFNRMDTSIEAQILVWKKIQEYRDKLIKARDSRLFPYEGTNKYTRGKFPGAEGYDGPPANKVIDGGFTMQYNITMKYTYSHDYDDPAPVTNIETLIGDNFGSDSGAF